MAADVETMKAKTVNGNEFSIEVEDGKVIKTDVAASNGIIHVMDIVVLSK